MISFTKDSNAVLDYKFDFAAATNGSGATDYLAAGETISTATITAETGITVNSSAKSDNDTSVVVWLSGGTAGTDYKVTCRIVTSASRTDDRSVVIQVRNL